MSRPGKHIFSHTLIYLLARGLPGIIAFASIPVFVHLLSPESYGRYALIVASANLLNALLFQWMRLSLVRYLPIYSSDTAKLKSTLVAMNAILVIAIGLLAAGLFMLPLRADWHEAILPCWLIMAITAAFELVCEYARASLRPWHFMVMQLTRSLLAVGLGALIVRAGADWRGPLAGIGIGMTLAVIYAAFMDWGDARLTIDREILRRLTHYGLPLSLTVALTIVIGTSDRFLIAHYLGEAAAGLYSVAVDFTTQTLMLVMMVVYMAVFPIAVRAFEKDGVDVAKKHMATNSNMLIAVGLPCVVGIAVLSPGVANTFLSADYRAAATSIMPLIALATFIGGIKACHFDAAFQFAHKTVVQIWIVLFAAIINVILNAIAIPRFGINGSAVASVLAYLISIALTISIGRRFFAMPFPVLPAMKAFAAAALMGIALWFFREHVSRPAFAVQVVGGAVVYAAGLLAMDFMDLRSIVIGKLRKRNESRKGDLTIAAAAPNVAA